MMNASSKALLLFMAVVVFAPICFAQHLLHEYQSPFYANLTFPGYANNGSYGASHTIAGDLDLDGYDDIVLGAPTAFGSGNRSGIVYAYSGRTGAELWSVSGAAEDRLGVWGISRAGHIDGDNIPDLLVTKFQPNGSYEIRAGSDGSLIHDGSFLTTSFCTLGPAGNLDGDGVDDYFVSYPSSGNGIVYVVSGATHTALRTHDIASPLKVGTSHETLGDIDSDGRDDYAIAYGCSGYTNCAAGMDVFSGATGALIFGERNPTIFPSSLSVVAAAGDYDGDGIGDLFWKLHSSDLYFNITLLLRQEIYSGATGTLIDTLGSTFPIRQFRSLGDLNGDSRDEWIGKMREAVVVTDPATDLVLHTQTLPAFVFGFFANTISTGGDVNGDGTPDFIFDTRYQNNYLIYPGHINVYSGATPSASESFCFGNGATPGCTPCPCGTDGPLNSQGGCLNSSARPARLLAIGDASVSEDRLRMEVRDAPPASFALLMSGANSLPQSGPCPSGSGITGLLTNGLRCVGGNLLRYGVRNTDTNGVVGLANNAWGSIGSLPSDLLTQSGLAAGQTRYFQAFYRDGVQSGCGTGVNTTNAVRITPRP